METTEPIGGGVGVAERRIEPTNASEPRRRRDRRAVVSSVDANEDRDTRDPGGGRRGACRAFRDVPPGPEGHFKIHLFGTVLALVDELGASGDALENALDRFPFLRGYAAQAAEEVEGPTLTDGVRQWWEEADRWEGAVGTHLPLRALRDRAELRAADLRWLMLAGLCEEDARFGDVFSALQGTPEFRRPTVALLGRCGRRFEGGDDPVGVLRRLRDLGLVEVVNPQDPRPEWGLTVPTVVWDVLRGTGTAPELDWARLRRPETQCEFDDLVVTEAVARSLRALPALLETGAIRVVSVRGPRHNGRHTVLGALARSMGLGRLDVVGLDRPEDPRWRLVGVLAVMLRALPVVEWDLAPGATATLPDWKPAGLPVGVVLGRCGGLDGVGCDARATLDLGMPGPEARRRLWARERTPGHSVEAADGVDALRLTSGRVVQLARLAGTQARLDGRVAVRPSDIRDAARILGHQALDTLAVWVPTDGEADALCVSERTRRELLHLERHCRYRERLAEAATGLRNGKLGCGVRALFAGPSGTGKTLAARALAARLGRDLYRIDLSSVVNKYVGETEKNLQRIFDRAEELDLVLLLDEGDSLLTRRTDVQSANDRYANLETNFLLQRLEGFEGIVLVTTNARPRIDPAFERRMDVVVDFSPPTAEERWQLWRTHLPNQPDIAEAFLRPIVQRCELTGGQIRNAALHATLLALDNDGRVTPEGLESAVRREYLKLGATCPLRASGG